MAEHDRTAWRRVLDLAVLGMATLAGAMLARRPTRAPVAAGGSPRQQDDARSGRGTPATPPSARALQAGYETADMHVPAMALVLLGLAAFVVVFSGAVIAMTTVFHGWNRNHPAFTPQQTARIVPPEPRLQPDPYAALRDERARQARLLDAYAWLNAGHTIARIPIDRAMALTVGKSLDAGP